jgi:hypothetical protein
MHAVADIERPAPAPAETKIPNDRIATVPAIGRCGTPSSARANRYRKRAADSDHSIAAELSTSSGAATGIASVSAGTPSTAADATRPYRSYSSRRTPIRCRRNEDAL